MRNEKPLVLCMVLGMAFLIPTIGGVMAGQWLVAIGAACVSAGFFFGVYKMTAREG